MTPGARPAYYVLKMDPVPLVAHILASLMSPKHSPVRGVDAGIYDLTGK